MLYTFSYTECLSEICDSWDCMYAWPSQGFRFSHKQSMQVEEDFKQLLDI